VFHGGSQNVLSEPCSHGDEDAHSVSRWVLCSLADQRFGVFPQNAQGQWISEDASLLQGLMGGTVGGRR